MSIYQICAAEYKTDIPKQSNSNKFYFDMPKSSVEQYQEFQDYTNYIDTSDVMLGFYKNQTGTGLEKYYLMIEEWLAMKPESQEDNKPLVIQADGGVGKKTLLAKWFEYHQSLKVGSKNDLIILHFATTGGNNSNYFYAIYRILIKLREELNIGQKVELHEQKLRKYFSYWLDVCDQRIEHQAIKNVETFYDKVILVFEGIDYFVDRGTGKEGNIAFWLPKYFPKNVKVIVTADGQSQSMRYFNNLGCPKVNIPYDVGVMNTMIKWQNEKELCVSGKIKDELIKIVEENIKSVEVTSLYVKSYISCLLPEKLDNIELSQESLHKLQENIEKINQQKLRQLKNVEELFEYLLDFWSKVLFQNEEKFRQLIGLLISTQKGLTRSEIISISKIEGQELKLFITIFRAFLMNFKDLWMIKNDSFKKSINKKYQFAPTEINQKIAEVLKKTPNSVRKLEEETFQLYSAGNYFKLKEVISDIQNFLLLFNPYTKYDLCRYWQKLEEKSFDPVIEYNKAIEGFEMHYHPTSDDLFRIITQISRFLREFSDFQTYYTPEFRHPKLIGNSKELDDIGILGEFRNLALFDEDQQVVNNEKNSTYEEQSEENVENEEEKKLKKKLKEMSEKIDQGKHIKKANNVDMQTKDTQKQKNQVQKKKKTKQVRIQQLNVEVKSNQTYFRQHYYENIKPFLEKVNLEGEKDHAFSIDNDKDDQYEQSEEEIESNNLVAKIKNIQKDKQRSSKPEDFKDLKNLYAKTVEQEFELNQKPPTNYYYKRWIWMQFPWVCMTMKCDYSDKLRKCFTSPTSYMSVSEEREFTIQALKIALQAKKKKQAILEKADDGPQLKKSSSSKITTVKAMDGSVFDKLSDRENNFKNKLDESSLIAATSVGKKPKRIQQLAFITNSFLSLHNLSKEMDNINCTMSLKEKSMLDESKGSLFITADDKTGDHTSLLHSFNKKKKKNLLKPDNLDVTSKTKQGLLPRIKQNINNEIINELEQLEKNNSQIRKEMDTYLYKNKILAKRLKELKILQYNNLSQVKNEKKIDERKKRISQIEQKIQKVKLQYAHSLLQHERLNVLIKICKKNKTQNEEAIPDLVFECNNFKKMIKIQNESIQELKKKTEEIKKLTKKFVANCCEKIQNQANLSKQIQQTFKNRQNFKDEVEKYDQMIVGELQEKRKQLNEMKHSSLHNKDENSLHQKKKPQFNAQEEKYQEIYNKVLKIINVEDNNYHENPQYQSLIEGLVKKREFESVLAERKAELEQIQKRYEESKKQLQTLTRAKEESQNQFGETLQAQVYESEVECHDDEQVLEKDLQDKKRLLSKTVDMKLSCLGMLNTLYARVGLGEQQKLVLTPEFVERFDTLRKASKVQIF